MPAQILQRQPDRRPASVDVLGRISLPALRVWPGLWVGPWAPPAGATAMVGATPPHP